MLAQQAKTPAGNGRERKGFSVDEPVRRPRPLKIVGIVAAVLAALVLAVIPIVVFYLSCQKYIIKGVAAGAVKG